MTRLLNKLASVLSKDNSQNEIKELLEKIQEQEEETLMVMSCLERPITKRMTPVWLRKLADDLVEQIDHETMPARSLLAYQSQMTCKFHRR